MLFGRGVRWMTGSKARFAGKRRAFVFSLEAAFSLTLAVIASSCLLAYGPQEESAGEFLACSDAAGALVELRAFSSQENLQAAVLEAGALLRTCVEAESNGVGASSCEGGAKGSGEKYSFTFPVWKGGRVENARAGCRRAG